LDAEVEINTIWEMIRENIKISAKESLGYYELKKYKPWFDKGCSKLLDQRKQAKLQRLQDPNEMNGDNVNNVRREASRHFRNKKREYLEDKINELAMNSKNKNIRDLYRWAGHEAQMGEKRNMYRLLVGKPEGKRPLGRPRHRWIDSIKLDLLEIGLHVVDWIGLAQDKYGWRDLVNAVMNLRVP
jgi:hypothetical protein